MPPHPTRHPGAKRIVAVGDIHGDLSALKQTLQVAQVINNKGDWIGGETVLVQTGDVLDRGDDEQEIIDFLDQLRLKARAKKGDIIELLGNHETMNVMGDLRYVTPGGYKDFEDVPDLKLKDARLARLPQHARPRMAALMPGGPYAKRLAQHNVVGVVGETLFVHGGILPSHVEYGLDKINTQVRRWMLGAGSMPQIVRGQTSPLWVRIFSSKTDEQACAVLTQVLTLAKVKRMVVGHTPQLQGPTQACQGRVWRVDVGMAKHYGGKPAALEIRGDKVTVLTANAVMFKDAKKLAPAQKTP